MNPAAIRLLNQQLAAPLFSRPEEVVGHMGAMQAQEYRLMRWAVGMRTRRPSAKAFRQAYDAGRISLPAEHRHRAHNNSGIFYPVVARDGIICGNWKPFAKTPEPQWFGDTGPAADPSWSDGSSHLPVPQRSAGAINSTVPQRSAGAINSTVPQRSAGAPDISAEWEAYQAFLLR